MFKLLFCVFLIIHLLADYYCQTPRIADGKQSRYRYIVLHGAVYTAVSMICVIVVWSAQLALAVAGLSLLHFFIDSIKHFYIKWRKIQPGPAVYSVDQLVHLASITVVASILLTGNVEVKLLPVLAGYLNLISIDAARLLAWFGALLIVSKPANITIKQLLAFYKPQDEGAESPNRAGAFIGTLERMIILLFLSAGQYAAIGLVLTAKSVARYNKIAENKSFAEYYLLGTLVSTLYALCAYLLFL